MTENDERLLLIDLCARQPYRVKILYKGQVEEIQYIEPLYNEVKLLGKNYTIPICDVKPYLRPLSSMTKEEEKEYHNLCYEEERERDEFGAWVTRIYYHDTIESIDWLNKNHFDYRGLIPRNLALEAPNGMYL